MGYEKKDHKNIWQSLYIGGICYHDFEENAPMYALKIGVGFDAVDRCCKQGIRHLITVQDRDYDFTHVVAYEGHFLTACFETEGANPEARYFGAGYTETFGKYETWEEMLERAKDIEKSMLETLEKEERRRFSLAIAA